MPYILIAGLLHNAVFVGKPQGRSATYVNDFEIYFTVKII